MSKSYKAMENEKTLNQVTNLMLELIKAQRNIPYLVDELPNIPDDLPEVRDGVVNDIIDSAKRIESLKAELNEYFKEGIIQ